MERMAARFGGRPRQAEGGLRRGAGGDVPDRTKHEPGFQGDLPGRTGSLYALLLTSGKVPLPGTRSTPFGVAQQLAHATRKSVSITVFPAQVSAVSAANECEGITCHWQVTRNGSDEAERSERSPPGVARNAGVEGVGRRRRTSKRRSRARERKCSATELASAAGEGGRGTCATSLGAIRRPEARCSLPSGQLACYCAQKLLPSGQLACS